MPVWALQSIRAHNACQGSATYKGSYIPVRVLQPIRAHNACQGSATYKGSYVEALQLISGS